MNQRIVLIHGWQDQPNRGWMAWLNKECVNLGYEFVAPLMPSPKVPVIADWVRVASKAITSINNQTILVGHSLGTNILLRFLAEYQGKPEDKARALILVSGFLQPGRKEAEALFNPLPNVEQAKSRVENIYSIYSDNDKTVLTSKSIELANLLGGSQLCLPGYGHFLTKYIDKIPELMQIIKNLD